MGQIVAYKLPTGASPNNGDDPVLRREGMITLGQQVKQKLDGGGSIEDAVIALLDGTVPGNFMVRFDYDITGPTGQPDGIADVQRHVRLKPAGQIDNKLFDENGVDTGDKLNIVNRPDNGASGGGGALNFTSNVTTPRNKLEETWTYVGTIVDDLEAFGVDRQKKIDYLVSRLTFSRCM